MIISLDSGQAFHQNSTLIHEKLPQLDEEYLQKLYS